MNAGEEIFLKQNKCSVSFQFQENFKFAEA